MGREWREGRKEDERGWVGRGRGGEGSFHGS